MRILLAEEHDVSPRLACDIHGFPLVYEDGDEDGAVYVCPVMGCRTAKYEGLSSHEIYRRDHGMGGFP